MNMKNFTLVSALLPVTAALLLGGKPAAAQVTLNLQKPFQMGTTGSTFQFFGTITNFGPTAVFLTGDTHSPDPLPAGVTLDDTPFLFNAPSQLAAAGPMGNAPGSSYTGEIFDVTLASGAAPGFYSGLFSLTGGTDPIASQFDTLNTNGFSIAAVPEASTTLSFGLLLALSGLALTAARRKKAAASA